MKQYFNVRGWLSWLAMVCAVLICRVIFRTVRMRFLAADPETHPLADGSEGFIYSFWHDQILFPLFMGRHTRAVALVSQHRDGSKLATVIGMVGAGVVRGSSNHEGAAALRQLLRLGKEKHVYITPDGPRGPRREIKPGLVYLASRARRRVVPMGYSATRSWTIPGSWTGLEVPKPFSTVYVLCGPPVTLSRQAEREQVEEVTAHLQGEMDRLSALAAQCVATEALHRRQHAGRRASLAAERAVAARLACQQGAAAS